MSPTPNDTTLPSRFETGIAPIRLQPAYVEQVAAQLRRQIVSGEIRVGDTLPPEGKLAKAFGVSRTVVREAMQSLRSQGLVEVSQGRAPRVRGANPDAVAPVIDALVRMSKASLGDLLEVRRPLEGEIAALAADRASLAAIADMQGSIDALLAAETLEGRIAADIRFHRLLAEATGNPLFPLVLTSIGGPLWESRRHTITRTGSERAAQGHQRILDALHARDAASAREEMLAHLDMAEQDLSLTPNVASQARPSDSAAE